MCKRNEFKISGKILEKESKLGVAGLQIKAYDKDLLFDDLLGMAVTNEQGEFLIQYNKKDFRLLFERKPDVYLSIYDPSSILIMDTKESVRFNASDNETFILEIEKEKLGILSPSLPENKVDVKIVVKEHDLNIENRNGFHYPVISRFQTGGKTGFPALPAQTRYVILPIGARIESIKIHHGEPKIVSKNVNPFPVQEIRPITPPEPLDFEFQPLTSRFFSRNNLYPQNLVELIKTEEKYGVQIAWLRVNPMRYDHSKKTYYLYRELEYSVKIDTSKVREKYAEYEKKKSRSTRIYSDILKPIMDNDLVSMTKFPYGSPIISNTLTIPHGPSTHIPDITLLPVRSEEIPYVIITNDYKWEDQLKYENGTVNVDPNAGTAGSFIRQFDRLAEWKNSRGMRTVVVSVHDIVTGVYGDFTENGFARDLQEIIRNFVKYIHYQWGTIYLLLGGYQKIVPMRRMIGIYTSSEFYISRRENPIPEDKKCYVDKTNNIVKVNFGDDILSIDTLLITYKTGKIVPFNGNSPGTNSLKWYYVSEDEFKNKVSGFTPHLNDKATKYAIIEGPINLIDDNFYRIKDKNKIWTDFYYSSIKGDHYSIQRKHDFDKNNNGLYGQYYETIPDGEGILIDDYKFLPDVFVGRAPVKKTKDAKSFVDKILSYEGANLSETESINKDYLKKILYGVAYLDKSLPISYQKDATKPPEEKRFTHVEGSNETHMKIDFKISFKYDEENEKADSISHRLVTKLSGHYEIIPYNINADESNLGWYFTDEFYSLKLTVATNNIIIKGPENKVAPKEKGFLWDIIGEIEKNTRNKEHIRYKNKVLFPEFNVIERHYDEIYDISPQPHLIRLEKGIIRKSIDEGFHFISLGGHGSSNGCCGVYVSDRPSFFNKNKPSIVYANSCLTSYITDEEESNETEPFEEEYSLGEHMVCYENAGAVAYVGYTSYGITGSGHLYEEFFWFMLKAYRKVGPALNWRSATCGEREIWMIYTSNLYGDPEMPVWVDVPGTLDVDHPEELTRRVNNFNQINVVVSANRNKIFCAKVTLMSDWKGLTEKPDILMSSLTDNNGSVIFKIQKDIYPPDKLRITVTHKDFLPYIGEIKYKD